MANGLFTIDLAVSYVVSSDRQPSVYGFFNSESPPAPAFDMLRQWHAYVLDRTFATWTHRSPDCATAIQIRRRGSHPRWRNVASSAWNSWPGRMTRHRPFIVRIGAHQAGKDARLRR